MVVEPAPNAAAAMASNGAKPLTKVIEGFAKGLQAQAMDSSRRRVALAVRRVLSLFVAQVVIANPLKLEPHCPTRTRKQTGPPATTQALLYTKFAGPHGPRGGLIVLAAVDCAKVSGGKLTLVN